MKPQSLQRTRSTQNGVRPHIRLAKNGATMAWRSRGISPSQITHPERSIIFLFGVPRTHDAPLPPVSGLASLALLYRRDKHVRHELVAIEEWPHVLQGRGNHCSIGESPGYQFRDQRLGG